MRNHPDASFGVFGVIQEVARYIREALPEEMKSKVPSKVSEKLGPAVMGPAPPLPVLYDVSPAEKLSPGRSWKVLVCLGCSPPYLGQDGDSWITLDGLFFPFFLVAQSWKTVCFFSEASSPVFSRPSRPEVGHQLQVSWGTGEIHGTVDAGKWLQERGTVRARANVNQAPKLCLTVWLSMTVRDFSRYSRWLSWKCGREPFSTPGELEVKAPIFQNHKLYWEWIWEWILVLPGQSTKFLMLICHASFWLGKCNCSTIASRLLRDGGTMRLGSQLEQWMSCYPKRKRPAHFPIAHGTFCAWTPVSRGKQAKHLHQVGQIKMIKIT